jgi:hypothetical protein
MARNTTDAHILAIIDRDRESIVLELTESMVGSGDVPMDRVTIEQLIRGVVAVLYEAVEGESADVRRAVLVAAVEVARSGTFTPSKSLRTALTVWGTLIGMVVLRANPGFQRAILPRLAQVQGEWMSRAWEAMYPAFVLAEGKDP